MIDIDACMYIHIYMIISQSTCLWILHIFKSKYIFIKMNICISIDLDACICIYIHNHITVTMPMGSVYLTKIIKWIYSYKCIYVSPPLFSTFSSIDHIYIHSHTYPYICNNNNDYNNLYVHTLLSICRFCSPPLVLHILICSSVDHFLNMYLFML